MLAVRAPGVASDIVSVAVICRVSGQYAFVQRPDLYNLRPPSSNNRRLSRGLRRLFRRQRQVMEMLWKSASQVDSSKGSSNLLRGAAATVGWLARNVEAEPALKNALKCRENHDLIGRAIDDRGRAQPALLAVADIHRGNADRRRLQDSARRIADHGIGQPERRPIALAAERSKQMGAAGSCRDEGGDGVVDHPVSRIGIDAGKNETAVLDLPQRPQKGVDVCRIHFGLRRRRMQGDEQESFW